MRQHAFCWMKFKETFMYNNINYKKKVCVGRGSDKTVWQNM